MRAAAIVSLPTETFEQIELPEPVNGDDELVLQVGACGTCGTDLHPWPVPRTRPSCRSSSGTSPSDASSPRAATCTTGSAGASPSPCSPVAAPARSAAPGTSACARAPCPSPACWHGRAASPSAWSCAQRRPWPSPKCSTRPQPPRSSTPARPPRTRCGRCRARERSASSSAAARSASSSRRCCEPTDLPASWWSHRTAGAKRCDRSGTPSSRTSEHAETARVSGPMSSKDLAEKTGSSECYEREWLNAQAAGGFVE